MIDRKEHILARLHLKAVLPTLAALVRMDDPARSLLTGENFGLRLSTRSGLSTSLRFVNGMIEIDTIPATGNPLGLLFVSDRQLNNAFSGRGLSIPIPWGGFRHLTRLRTFSRLAARLHEVLDASPEALHEERLLRLHVDLLLGELIPSAIAELADCDELSRRWLDPYRGAMAQFTVQGGVSSWVHVRAAEVVSGCGRPAESPDVVVTFRDYSVALAAIRGELDNLAALGLGRVTIQGLIPFADALDRVMDRIARFLRH